MDSSSVQSGECLLQNMPTEVVEELQQRPRIQPQMDASRYERRVTRRCTVLQPTLSGPNLILHPKYERLLTVHRSVPASMNACKLCTMVDHRLVQQTTNANRKVSEKPKLRKCGRWTAISFRMECTEALQFPRPSHANRTTRYTTT